MKVFIIGISGAVGGLLTERLLERGSQVSGLVRTEDQQRRLDVCGASTYIGDLAAMDAAALAPLLDGMDVLVFAAGSNGGRKEETDAIDSAAVDNSLAAAQRAGVRRFVLVSVFPEAWRERDLSDDEEYYFAVKKLVDIKVSRSSLDWLILRPSLLQDRPGQGTVFLGPAAMHEDISRGDVAEVLTEILLQPAVTRQILEVTSGRTPIVDAVRLVVTNRST
ncbi:NAD-dependent epimerase/dehydratase family protein [Arthrobacter crusticola]|uniref:NAD-dependent epimerase/dehydratase family protein n=1 Tax=Arthrobacter crusticola TaxID=2547960 RepID=A0A4R5TNU6_9MICC|nr:NAD(P)H-binding protein [Arthrobacter crusticola]TDK23674.1 NAD-dependent epimerase/dehydratase family protein [Arthrobacter crusticola]